MTRATSGADGRWSTTFRFPVDGRFELFAVAGADTVNAQGQSAPRSVLVS